MQQAAEQLQLVREDLLWAGLSFPVLTEEELAHQQAAVEDRVHFHRGVWWRRAGPCFYLPCFPFAQIDHRNSWPHPARALAGFMHISAPNSPSNGVYRALLRENLASYSILSLPTDRRTKLRKALSQLTVRPVERLEDLLGHGYEVYLSWHERVRWGRNRTDRGSYRGWISRAFLRPKRLTLGAYLGDRLVAFMLPYVVADVAVQSYVASHSDFMRCRPNEAITHAFMCVARQTPRVCSATLGTVSAKPSLDHFKQQFCSIKEFPCYTWISPLMRPMFNKWIRPRYPWLGGGAAQASRDSENTGKAE